MAVKFIDHITGGWLGFWEISEDTGELLEWLNPQEEELEHFSNFRNEQRKKEWLAARLLLRQMAGPDASIKYTTRGKPILEGAEGFISISHTSGGVVIFLHPTCQPGIDIESVDRNVEGPAKKFLSEGELIDCTVNGQLVNKELILRWCAKEAVFKMIPNSDIDFSHQIRCVSPPSTSMEGNLHAFFRESGSTIRIPLQYKIIGNLVIVWGVLSSREK